MSADVDKTLIMSFVRRAKYRKFLEAVKHRPILNYYLQEHVDNTIWFKFDTKEQRDAMMTTLKDTVPHYHIRVNNQQEQMRVI